MHFVSPVSFLSKTEPARAQACGPAKPLGRRSGVRGRALRFSTRPSIGKGDGIRPAGGALRFRTHLKPARPSGGGP